MYKLLIWLVNIPKYKMSKPTDDQLRQAIDAIFNKYDADQSGTLEDN